MFGSVRRSFRMRWKGLYAVAMMLYSHTPIAISAVSTDVACWLSRSQMSRGRAGRSEPKFGWAGSLSRWSCVVANHRYRQYAGLRKRIHKFASHARHRRQLVQPWRMSNELVGGLVCVVHAARRRESLPQQWLGEWLNLIPRLQLLSSCTLPKFMNMS